MWEIEESGNGKHLLWTQVWCLLYVHTDMHVCAHVNTTHGHACVHVHVHTCIHARLQSSLSSVLCFYDSSFLITPESDNLTQKKPNPHLLDFP